MSNTIRRIKEFIDFKGISVRKFEEIVGFSNGSFASQYKNNKTIGVDKVENILQFFPEISSEWLLTGNGEMIKPNLQEMWQNKTATKTATFSEETKNANNVALSKEPQEKYKVGERDKLIPLYNDVATIGGTQMVASLDAVSSTTEYIDAGDWFPDATAAIRHYSDSMIEYPSGCILAIREVLDLSQLLWGRNYSIETNEIRVTKCLQRSSKEGFLMGYSTNIETYPDGRLKHEPIEIEINRISHLALILGYVVKEYSSGPLYVKK